MLTMGRWGMQPGGSLFQRAKQHNARTASTHAQVHRWGSAFPARPFGSPCLTAESARLAACGDYCLGAGVENAVLSGQAAAEAVSRMLGERP
jgi:predicted NAD/FAD-dependent oxidoreductase